GIATIHNIGKSFQGRDLLVLEVTNRETGAGLSKPGFWIDGNLHASEVMGAAVTLHNIDTLVKGYGNDPFITDLIDTRVIYLMPKLNPDGSEHYLTKPDGMRSSVRPHDSDRDGSFDEDPGEDLNGDRNLTQMRIRDPEGNMRTSPDDPRLMVRVSEGEQGEWRTMSEGIDNDGDGRVNEDGVGGLDINRNWPSRWQQEYIQGGAGPYPLSEPETRSVAEFILAHPNITGLINHHMAGNFVYRPPTNRNFDVGTGEEIPMPAADEANFAYLGRKYTEVINGQEVTPVFGRSGPPLYGAIWGVMIGWAYDHVGIYSWVPEMGSLVPFCDYDGDGNVSETERMRWNDSDWDGRLFVDWQPFNHPVLGEVEIGGWVSKVWMPEFGSYTNTMCAPGAVFEDFLQKHTEWNLWLVAQSPLVRIADLKVEAIDSGFFKVTAAVVNQGYLPTNVTEQAIRNRMAGSVEVSLSLDGADLVMGDAVTDIGHLQGNGRRTATMEWMVKTTGGRAPTVTITVTSVRGGTDSREVVLR
ncbi:M14 family metallopeptidase, partial [Gemmatimonadota bacterium]